MHILTIVTHILICLLEVEQQFFFLLLLLLLLNAKWLLDLLLTITVPELSDTAC